MTRCPYCAEEIQEAAIRCKHCQADLGTRVRTPAARSSVPAMSTPTFLGVIGSALLLIGVFTPIMSAPIVGNQNYFHQGKGAGIIIIALALVSMLLTLGRNFRALWASAIASLAVLGFTYYTITSKINSLKNTLDTRLAGNPLRGLADLAMQTVQIQWGWAVLVAGAVLVIGAATTGNKQGSRR